MIPPNLFSPITEQLAKFVPVLLLRLQGFIGGRLHTPLNACFCTVFLTIDPFEQIILIKFFRLGHRSHADDSFSDRQEMLEKLVEGMICKAAAISNTRAVSHTHR